MPKKILVIDDDLLVTKTLVKYLRTCDYEVDSVLNGEEAVKKIEENPFNLIIADVRMPGMNGIETLKKLRSVCQNKYKTKIPEIIITGYANAGAREEAEKMGISDYIFKPFDIDVFIETIQKKLKG